jgi:hypothetical protein
MKRRRQGLPVSWGESNKSEYIGPPSPMNHRKVSAATNLTPFQQRKLKEAEEKEKEARIKLAAKVAEVEKEKRKVTVQQFQATTDVILAKVMKSCPKCKPTCSDPETHNQEWTKIEGYQFNEEMLRKHLEFELTRSDTMKEQIEYMTGVKGLTTVSKIFEFLDNEDVGVQHSNAKAKDGKVTPQQFHKMLQRTFKA